MTERPPDAHRALREQLGVYALGHGTADERAVQRAWARAQAELDALLAAPAPTEQRRAELRDGWAGQYASTVGRGRTSQHVQSSRADVRAALRTSWKTSPP